MSRLGSRTAAVGAVAALVVSVSAGSASADPPVPAAQDIVGVGSQTTQALLNQLSRDYNASLPAGSTAPHLYSWDATGSAQIIPKAGAAVINRPNGTVRGIDALNANTSTTVDFARASRPGNASDPHGLAFVQLAKDAVTWSAKSGGNAPASLTQDQLTKIYNCTYTNWRQIDPSLANARIKPYLPQAASGTRAVFLAAINNLMPGTCVTTGPEENQGTDAALNDPDVVFPYSIGHYIGQTNGHASGADATGPLTLRNVVVGGTSYTPVVSGAINTSLVNTVFGRYLFDVFRYTEWTATDAHGQALQAIFGSDGWICNDPVAAADITSHGFLSSIACGTAWVT